MFTSVFTVSTGNVWQSELLLSDEEKAIRLAEEVVMQDGFGWEIEAKYCFRNLCLTKSALFGNMLTLGIL